MYRPLKCDKIHWKAVEQYFTVVLKLVRVAFPSLSPIPEDLDFPHVISYSQMTRRLTSRLGEGMDHGYVRYLATRALAFKYKVPLKHFETYSIPDT